MDRKEFPYWLKGGLFGLAFGLIFFIVDFLLFKGTFSYLNILYLPYLLMDMIIGMIYPYGIGVGISPTTLTSTMILFYFLIGTLIGWVFGKIKSRK